MTLLLSPDALAARRLVAEGPLAPLAASLRGELALLLDGGVPWIPAEKARLTRGGGRCPSHGVLLEFDPLAPRAHRCPVCGVVFQDEVHYRWWIMNYQLWLAQRAVHASALYALGDDPRCAALARHILLGYSAAYDDYPNRDNVLGPTRPFFSTYLESIWLLQLSIALDLLEGRDGRSTLGDEVRARLLRPSASLIASYDEGMSNRQVYHNAALMAAGALLGDEAMVTQARDGPSGLCTHLAQGLLADGTWYEGENYHLFAHRGLWYGVVISERMGRPLDASSGNRFRDAFAAPFATALPDLTFPSRRDSQYTVSLRQWRMAESCELGLARGDDPRLEAALAELYRTEIASGDAGRQHATAEAERNLPPVRLSRESLGWKSLLMARATLPPLIGQVSGSALLAGQGIAVLRREHARVFSALDYGESGGGHGHPDRLNLWLVVGRARVLEDVGTGSYVDPTLHWYRSTLAHNAPLVDGRSQWRTAGELLGYDEQELAGLVAASARIAPGVRVERTVVVMPTYLIDEVRWYADRTVTFDLPWHMDADFADGRPWRSKSLGGGRGVEDGYDFLSLTEHSAGKGDAVLAATVDDLLVRLWTSVDVAHEWWRCVAPGPPGEGRRRFLLFRARARAGVVRTLLSWKGDVAHCAYVDNGLNVTLGVGDRHQHRRSAEAWTITMTDAGAPSPSCVRLTTRGKDVADRAIVTDERTADGLAREPSIVTPIRLRSMRARPESLGLLTTVASVPETGPTLTADGGPGPAGKVTSGTATVAYGGDHLSGEWAHFRLGAESYRRSEASWQEAGSPQAVVAVAVSVDALLVEVDVHKAAPTFAPRREQNDLDNEHPDVNSDGVQLHLGASPGAGRYYTWILVPEMGGQTVRVTARGAFGPTASVTAIWRLTPTGYILRAEIPRQALGEAGSEDFTLDVVVNEISPDRERRRGQLVLSGGFGEWIYLRGDRQDPLRALSFHIYDH